MPNQTTTHQNELPIGSWSFSQEHREAVRILEVQSLWGHTTCQVWVPSRGQVAWVRAESLTERPDPSDHLLDSITYAACATRIADALAQNVLLAPLEAGVIPLPHQLQALSRAVSDTQIRYLLADEVGLGKTIEAGLVIRELKLRGLVKRVLVVAPKGLVPQWVSEMRTHFGEDFRPVSPGELSAFRDFMGDDNVWTRFDQVVCSLDSIKPVERRRGWTREKLERHNQERLGDIIAAGWDLIVVDEAHRVGGSTETVARHKLGRALSEAAPYLLLLSATPHQGKTEAFHRLMTLLDRDAFPDLTSIKREDVAPFVIRTEKRRAINDRGEPLFQPRSTRLVPVTWEPRHEAQKQLYEAVTEYVREGYDQAIRQNRQYLGFLMLLMQRLVTSSTRAIATALGRRLEVLQDQTGTDADGDGVGTDWWDQDGQELLEALAAARIAGVGNEIAEVRLLLELAQRCQAQGPDARAEALLDLLYTVQGEENDPDLKFLIFTEFVPTQETLADLLGQHGFSAVTLNGSMTLEERQRAQRRFSEDIRVLVSTDAGGEGLNLQFAHVVINYDLPWNPMRVEQRIGRVDRIGQAHPVRAFNLLLGNSVELRVQEVLAAKLQTILEEFGVDKTGDVLDSEEAGALFEQTIARAIMNPESLEADVDELIARVRARARDEAEGRSMYDAAPLDPEAAARMRDHPIQHWMERMVTTYLRSHGGKAERDLLGWNLTWTDGSKSDRATFVGRDAVEQGLTHLGFQDQRVRSLIDQVPLFVPGAPVTAVVVPGLPAGVTGHWALWRVGLQSGSEHPVRALPIFCHDDGRTLQPTARLIWDRLVEGAARSGAGTAADGDADALQRLRAEAERQGQAVFEELAQRHQDRLRRQREKGELAYGVRREALRRIGLPEVRDYRLRRLEDDERRWLAELARRDVLFPELSLVLVLRVMSGE